jgi:type IV pilus assembly protein PilC
MTRIVVGISEFCLKNFIPVLSAAFLFLILLLVLLRIRAVKLRWSAFILKIPMIGVLIHKAIVARFCHTFSILLYGGAGVIMSLSVASGVAGNIFVMQIIEQIRTQVVGGISLGEAMKSQSFFPRMVTRMISVGEKTGKLDEMFKRSAEYYEEELEATLANFASLIEPVFIVMLGSVVLIVVLALYLPIFKISMAVK